MRSRTPRRSTPAGRGRRRRARLRTRVEPGGECLHDLQLSQAIVELSGLRLRGIPLGAVRRQQQA